MLTKILLSWATKESPLNSTTEILEWIRHGNSTIKVAIEQIALKDSDFWFYDSDSGIIKNHNNSFFSIYGLQQKRGEQIVWEQPVILQDEIGYLGLICKEIGGVLHFLMQAKIEPGNINKIQLSPTIQATKSNFTQKHGGNKPAYLEYFQNTSSGQIIVDQIQSEQSSRFYKKRNRNIILYCSSEIEVLSSHRWMTLGQIKELMRYDNLVNMDTRTVLSCIPYSIYMNNRKEDYGHYFSDKSLHSSMLGRGFNYLPEVFHYMNNYKMFNEITCELTPLWKMHTWQMHNLEYICKNPCSFKVIFCDIAIEQREVKRWTQPLFAASGIATFGLITFKQDGCRMFVIAARPEVGCFDQLEIGPSAQIEANIPPEEYDEIANFFHHEINFPSPSSRILVDVLLSEEGGRFWHEQNRNVILEVDQNNLGDLPEGYFAVDFSTLNRLCQVNNTLNIQLRNLLSLIDL